MKAKLDTRYLKTVTAENKITRHWDTEISGYLLQVSVAGTMTFYYRYQLDGVRHTYKIGRYPDMTAAQGRKEATIKAGEVGAGKNVQKKKQSKKRKKELKKKNTLRGYIDNVYKDHLLTANKSGAITLQAIEAHFGQWDKRKLTEINPFLVGNWRKAQLKKGRTAGGVNRPIAYLRALLNHAYREAKVIKRHPLGTFKPLPEDKCPKTRYLDEKEEKSLRAAMVLRDDKARIERDTANQWRETRGYKLLPTLPLNGYMDYLTPMVLLALNTGMRRGELFNLQWADIDFKAKDLTIHASGAKSGKTRHQPLNGEALGTLIKWRNQSVSKSFVFTGKNGKLTDVKTAFNNLLKSAGIHNFRFHDLRHQFASKLAMKGVELNTIRELLGHSNMEMTMRYAHLAPSVKASAVELL